MTKGEFEGRKQQSQNKKDPGQGLNSKPETHQVDCAVSVHICDAKYRLVSELGVRCAFLYFLY